MRSFEQGAISKSSSGGPLCTPKCNKGVGVKKILKSDLPASVCTNLKFINRFISVCLFCCLIPLLSHSSIDFPHSPNLPDSLGLGEPDDSRQNMSSTTTIAGRVAREFFRLSISLENQVSTDHLVMVVQSE